MRVNIFVLKAGNDSQPALLLLPDDKPQMIIPEHLQPWGWQYFMTTVSGDDLIRNSTWAVDARIQRDGYWLQAAPSGTA